MIFKIDLVNVLLGFLQNFRLIPIMNPLSWFMIQWLYCQQLQQYGYKLGFCGYISDSLGVDNFRPILGLVDAFTIGLSV